ncbi:carboxypeptidase-like regulatory domain-containing protein [Halorubrum sp. RMP-47]|uniref:Carboxypeptidase-like regulatory domain-containing protein n=1 Tax=Halorubrum miltondacostae TaxID=3076378 RepID=A0ABD5M6U6_9EURY
MNVSRPALVVAVALLVAAVAAGGVAGQQADPVTLTVAVTDQDGDALGGVTVDAAWETESGETGTVSGATASNGKVFLDVPEGASVELDVDDDTYVRNRPLQIDEATARDVNLGVTRSGTATVSVVDGQNRSQADARVTVREDGRTVDRGETGSDGTYETARLERGDYEVVAVKPGYFEASRTVTVAGDNETEIAIERGTTTLDVRTFDDHFDPPMPIETGAVRASSSVFDGRVSVTEGTASLTVPVNALYTVEVVKEGYESSVERVRVRESPVSANATAQRSAALSVSAANEAVIVGETTRVTVRNAYDEPVAGAAVEVDGEVVGETDDRGEIEVPIRTAGDRTVVARNNDATADLITVTGVEQSEEPAGNDSGDEGAGSAGDGSDGGDGDTDDRIPGFGVVAALLAVLTVAAASRVRGR